MQLKLFFLLFNLFFKLLGAQPPQTAIILLQNNNEIRATGGFMGSYAKIVRPAADIEPALSLQRPGTGTLTFQDIYVPDGQLKGHVEPPVPIQQAFGQGWYKLRDANWEPDFPTSAKTIRWFLEKGGEINPDLLITLNLSTIQKILALASNIKVPNLDIDINSSNISLTLQNQIQQNFFPGSTNKKDLLTETGQAFLQKISHLPLTQQIKIIQIIFQDIKTGEILINSKNPKLQAYLERKDYAGQLKPQICQPAKDGSKPVFLKQLFGNLRRSAADSQNCLQDTVAIIESNLGSNKANAYITRHTTHKIKRPAADIEPALGMQNPVSTGPNSTSANIGAGTITHQITIDYQNSSPSKNPDPPNHHGGDYINYLRIYIPQQATNIQATSGSELSAVCSVVKDSSKPCSIPTITTNNNFTEIGLFHLTPHQSTSSVTISYQLPIKNQKTYQLTLIKQPGIGDTPQTINLFGQITNTNLTQDTSLTAPKNIL